MASIAIIGAGPAGLVAAKSALECGLKPQVFEKAARIGGLWKPTTGFTWNRMQTNLSRYSCMFSDFPWKASAPLFPNQSEVYDYLQDYSQNFDLNSHIQFNAEVLKIEKQNAQWQVKWHYQNVEQTQLFDYLIVATGVFSKGSIPKICNSDTFKGSITHSQSYQTPDIYKGKKVAIVGNASSGVEIAAEVATVAKQVFHITRRTPWVIPRYIPNASKQHLPLDFVFFSRADHAQAKEVAEEEKNLRANAWFKELTKQETYDPILSKEITAEPPLLAISDAYLKQVKAGNIAIKQGKIHSFLDHSVILEDQKCLDIDAALFCTGYQTSLSFLDKSLLQTVEFEPNNRLQPLILHQCTLHPEIPELGFVGLYNAPFLATMELQARLACQVFSGITTMPAKDKMLRGLSREREFRSKQPEPQARGDYMDLSESLAKEIGVLPDFTKLKHEDPLLHSNLWNGPFLAAHYRLSGFGSEPEVARQIIEEANQ